MRLAPVLWTMLSLALPTAAAAATSDTYSSTALTARLITAEDGVAPEAGTLSAGLVLEMADGWKTYWRSPGEVGLPPELDWGASDNLASTELLFPAPTRFTAFDIENFGYGDAVTFPIQVALESPGQPARLATQVRLLVCKDICIPEDFTLTLDLPQGTGIDTAAAETLADALARVPAEEAASGLEIEAAHLSDTALTFAVRHANGFRTPDVFPELDEAIFGKPDLRLDSDRTRLWAEVPLLYPLDDAPEALRLTVTDGSYAGTISAELGGSTPPAPSPGRGLVAMALIAVLGGLILNVMPCVLPVLSIKLAAAVRKSDQGRARVRAGFLLSAAGVLTFFWALAAVTWGLQTMGHAVGWGLQFQSPVFLSTMIVILVLFAANLFGLFELSLPAALQTRLSVAGGSGRLGDFTTGAFAAVLATPCSAPFLGTAVAYAMSGGGREIAVIFTALGFGLALPYLAVAAFPGVVALLPKPGRWMLALKLVMGGLLALTAAWLFFVLTGVAGLTAAALTATLMALILVALAFRRLPGRVLTVAALAALTVALPALRDPAPAAAAQSATNWVSFDATRLAEHVDAGKIVFVDVTADWCLTCKANKALVLDRGPVSQALATEDILPMQADWTRPDPAISAYLESFGRFGIPFNAVYGPAAPNGIPLPEILSEAAIFEAIEQAGG
ncbi:Cytochrome c-type biogenesis protein DsbD, protein-disulfide reductase [Marinovum algicola DG 898]|nr:Cytochrome c-type biogenesis protein DsbD, protein-disulfide reductase [Marinovum algicola DG 898]